MVVLTRSRTKAKVLSGMTGSLQILAEFFTVAEVGALCLLSKVVNHAVNDERVKFGRHYAIGTILPLYLSAHDS